MDDIQIPVFKPYFSGPSMMISFSFALCSLDSLGLRPLPLKMIVKRNFSISSGKDAKHGVVLDDITGT